MEQVWWLLPFAVALVVGGLCPLTGTVLLVQRRLFLVNLVSQRCCPGWPWRWRSASIRVWVV